SSPFPRRARGSVMFARSSRTGGLPGGGARRRSLRLGGLLVGCVALALAMLTFSASAAKDDLDLVSRATGVAGAKGNADALRPAISGDGRFVAFASSASNLAADDGDIAQDVFVRDLQTNTTTVVSRASGANGVKGNDTSLNATLSSDGRFVAFDSGASNLDPADTDHNLDLFVRRRQTNPPTPLSRASGTGGAKANNPSQDAAISADGRFVAFESFSTNLTPDANRGIEQVFVRDLQTNTTTLVSRASGANAPEGDDESDSPAISADGRFVAFTSLASNLDPADGLTGGKLFVPAPPTNTTTR